MRHYVPFSLLIFALLLPLSAASLHEGASWKQTQAQALSYEKAGDLKQAEEVYLEARQQAAAASTENLFPLIESTNDLAAFYWQHGNYTKAVKHLEEVLSLMDAVYGSRSPV